LPSGFLKTRQIILKSRISDAWCVSAGYSQEIRKAIYTTNAVESLNASLRKVIKNKRIFPSDDAVLKQLYLALKNISKKWTMPIQNWKEAMNAFIIMFEERLSDLI